MTNGRVMGPSVGLNWNYSIDEYLVINRWRSFLSGAESL